VLPPATLTEPWLAQYLHTVLGTVADVLGLSPGGDDDARGSYDVAILHTVLAYYGDAYLAGDALSGATDLQRLLVLARREAWRLAAGRAAGEFDFASAGTSESRGQLYKQITAELARAEAEAAGYDTAQGAFALGIDAVFRPHDPYASLSADERVLP